MTIEATGFLAGSGRKAYWTCQAAGWGAYSAIGLGIATEYVGWRPSVVAGYLFYFLYSIGLTDLLRREIHRREWLSGPRRRVFLRLFSAAIAIGAIQTVLIFSFALTTENRNSDFFQAGSVLGAWLGTTYATGAWIGLYIRITARRRRLEKDTRLQLALRDAELRALEAQVNPHFLFNCLNSIRALVVENPAQAQDMITRLANMLRYSLHRDRGHTVPLASELEAVTDYLALESVRFEDRLRVKLAIDDDSRQVPIPPMLLQTLIENAVKHGIATVPGGGELVIRASLEQDCMMVEVENTGQLRAPKPGATGLGLRNVRDRLRVLYGDRASLQLEERGGRVAATLRIPRVA
jgi:glucose-6-phosphate-specific signal transduction histidine kinase